MASSSRSGEQTDPCTLLLAAGPGDTAQRHGACLVVIRGERLGARLDLAALPAVIGRGSNADFRIPSRSVSRSHCRVFARDGEPWVEDLRSTNQTLVNGEPIERVQLTDGDQIRIGDSVLKFLGAGNLEAGYLAEMREHAVRDELTGLYNRRYLMTQLADAIGLRGQTSATPLSLAIIDVDLFKDINDLIGHLAGDDVLRQLGKVLSGGVRTDDILARIGGEEFAVIMPGQPLKAALAICERLRQAVDDQTFRYEEDGRLLEVTISIGVAEWQTGQNEMSDLLKAADEQLYQAKSAGRNRVCG